MPEFENVETMENIEEVQETTTEKSILARIMRITLSAAICGTLGYMGGKWLRKRRAVKDEAANVEAPTNGEAKVGITIDKNDK